MGQISQLRPVFEESAALGGNLHSLESDARVDPVCSFNFFSLITTACLPVIVREKSAKNL